MLILYGHPFSSYTQKVLIALYENATPFELAPTRPSIRQSGCAAGRCANFRC